VSDDRLPTSPLWRAWQGTSRARLLAAGAVAITAGVSGVLLAGGEDEPVRRTATSAASTSPTPSSSPSPEPSPLATASPVTTTVPTSTPTPAPAEPSAPAASATPSADPTAVPAVLQLDGDDLGVTRVGAPYADAVRALTAVLGPPVADPAPATACVGAYEREVEWAGFRLAITDGTVSGWSSSDVRLTTPSGVGIGTTVTELREVEGERLELYDATPDSGPGFAVRGVELGGSLTGPGGDDRVTGFSNRACNPP